MATTGPTSPSYSSGERIPLELEGFEDVTLLQENPLQPGRMRWWKGLKSVWSIPKRFVDRRRGFARLDTTEPPERDPDVRWCPEETAGFFSRIFFIYANSLMERGFRKHLHMEDLWDLAKTDEAQPLVDRFHRKLEGTREPIKAPQGSLLRAMLRSHGARFLLAGIIKFFHDILQFMGPFILQQLLKHLEDENGSGQSHMLMGSLLALAMFASQVLQTILVNQYFHILFRMTLHLKCQLVQTVYRKSLRITASVKSDRGIGTIVNLQSNDASKLWGMPSYLHVLWSGPFQILTVMGMLVRIIGWLPAFAGLMVTVALIPMNAFAGKFIAKYRKEKMLRTDSRVKLTTEIITGIKAIKLYAWEKPYSKTINELRDAELTQIKKTGILAAFNRMVFFSGPILIALAGFGTFTAMGGKLTASVAFPALALFQLLRFPVMMFPNQITNLINGSVALKRLQSFMEADEMDQSPPAPAAPLYSDVSAVSIKDGTFSWGVGEDPVLADVNLEVRSGQLVMVVGEVGSGKTSMLGAILGELYKVTGKVKVAGSIAYTAQDAWIQNSTLRNNILLGKPMDEDLYADVLSSCALLPDLDLLTAGDETEIGEKGVNLSGGQKQRVALARACYSGGDVMLLDDPLSAVDAHVGRHIFTKCISGLLSNKTRILVTHQLQYLPGADVVVVVQKGRITQTGTYAELKEKGVQFDEFKMDSEEKNSSDDASGSEDSGEILNNSRESDGMGFDEDAKKIPLGTSFKNLGERDQAKQLVRTLSGKGKGNLIKAEERAVGQVKKSVYLTYLRFWGPCFLMPGLLMLNSLSEKGFQAMQNWWLSVWSHGHREMEYYMMFYFGMGLFSIVFTLVGAMLLLYGSVNASRRMHNKLLNKVMTLPMSFFDTQPSGRLINRFARDTEALDGEVGGVVSMALSCFVNVSLSVIVVVAVSPEVILPILSLAFLYVRVQRRYLATSREIKRLDSLAMSPIYSHFSESLTGIQTVRAFRKQKDFALKNEALVNSSNTAQWPLLTANRWLSMQLEIMSGSIVFVTALMVTVVSRKRAGLAGLALTSALSFTGMMNWLIRQVTQLEVSMNCVERMVEYDSHESEKAAIIPGKRPPPKWPHEGSINITNLWVRYRPDLDPVLKGVTISIRGKEKIGICGRTGCGKSTLMMSLFRIIEPHSGNVVIDGLDTGKMGLYDLRAHLSLVPQDPIIFSGSVRLNLDPFNNASGDAEIWEALKQAGLEAFIKDLEGGLDAQISEGGGNLSSGQRQLLCMARALLRGSRILILDEATSNVDNTTDSLIQQTIRSAFKDYTILTIAHRLHTIVDYDRILVLDAGEVKEFDTPANLLKDSKSMFSELMEEATRSRGGDVKRTSSAVMLQEKISQVREGA
ncbi:hypothetical protein BSKO_03817 [Bryopsis sp. KO-2023]|nr:hypothetical protein BSKO_03817 [Bryopsis sp. KO-2023]